jgi:hypothetical protein
VERVTEGRAPVILVGDISEVLVDLGMPPKLGIPQDPSTAGNVLEVVGTILERLRESYTYGHGPWD